MKIPPNPFTSLFRGNPILFALLACLFLLGETAAQETPIALSLDREDGLYRDGERAEVTIAAAPEILQERGWNGTVSWQRNWEGESHSFDWSPEEPFRLSLAEKNPGQVVVTATLRAQEDPSIHHVARIGFLYRPEEIRLSTAEPADFDTFWDEQKARWRSLPQDIELTPVDSPNGGIAAWDLTIRLDGETPVSGYLALPVDAQPGSLPAILFLHGAGVRSSSLPTAIRAAEEGFLALDINAHGLPNGRPPEFYAEREQTALRGYRQEGVEAREAWYFRTMYLRVLTAIDYLCAREEWNGEDLVLRGSSQGGGQAFAGAGLDERVSLVVASVPALCDIAGIPSQRKAGWPQPVSFSKDADRQAQILNTIPYFDGGHFARRIQAPMIVSIGLADPVCPAVGIQATVNNYGGPVEIIYRPTLAHAYPAEIRQAFDAFVKGRIGVSRP